MQGMDHFLTLRIRLEIANLQWRRMQGNILKKKFHLHLKRLPEPTSVATGQAFSPPKRLRGFGSSRARITIRDGFHIKARGYFAGNFENST